MSSHLRTETRMSINDVHPADVQRFDVDPETLRARGLDPWAQSYCLEFHL